MLLLRTLLLLALVAAPHLAAAHGAGAPGSYDFVWAPWVVASLSVAALLYWRGVARLERRNAGQRILTASRQAAFAAGLVAVAAALLSPLDAMADDLFSAHMLQHVILLLIAPPLFVGARPAIAMLWALPLAGRKRVGRAWVGLGGARGLAALMHPMSVWLLFTGAILFWHLPVPYGWALRSAPLHVLEHTSFFLTALAFWSLVIEPSGRRRMGDGACLLFIAGNGALGGLPGALMMLAPRPLYPVEAARLAAWHLSPLADQQLAGAVMWIIAGLIYLGAALLIAWRWLSGGERQSFVLARTAHLLPLLLLTGLLLSACGDSGEQAAKARVGGDPKRGTELIRNYGCAGCHTIPGITGADGLVGPPLTSLSRRAYLAGLVTNTPDHLVAWLRNPQAIAPGNVMPDMGLSDRDARDIATYLYTIK